MHAVVAVVAALPLRHGSCGFPTNWIAPMLRVFFFGVIHICIGVVAVVVSCCSCRPDRYNR